MNKKMDYTEYTTLIGKTVKKVFFLKGDSTYSILQSLRALQKNTSKVGSDSFEVKDKIMGTYNNLEKLLTDVKKVVKPGDTVLFSPAATSFNLFQNEFDRGRQFNEAVKKVFI